MVAASPKLIGPPLFTVKSSRSHPEFAVTILDGSTAIATIPAVAALGQSAPYCVQLGIRATSPTTGFKITTGASVSVIAVGRFSN